MFNYKKLKEKTDLELDEMMNSLNYELMTIDDSITVCKNIISKDIPCVDKSICKRNLNKIEEAVNSIKNLFE